VAQKKETRIRTIPTKQWYKKKRGMDKNNSHKIMVQEGTIVLCELFFSASLLFVPLFCVNCSYPCLSSFCTIVLCELFLSMPLLFTQNNGTKRREADKNNSHKTMVQKEERHG
jgi:hypothetical protein